MICSYLCTVIMPNGNVSLIINGTSGDDNVVLRVLVPWK
jgi:hypothetical protein